jgi:uncharacterized protein (TIGR00369 family)
MAVYRPLVATRRLQVPPNCDLTLGVACLDKSTPGRTVWQMVADERFENPAGIMQGGFLAALADSSMGAAAVTFARDRRVSVANAEMKISFLAAVRAGSVLRCDAAVVAGGERTAFVEASITDEADRLVARASSTYLYRERN